MYVGSMHLGSPAMYVGSPPCIWVSHHLACTYPCHKTLMFLCFAWFGWTSIKQVGVSILLGYGILDKALHRGSVSGRIQTSSRLDQTLVQTWSKLIPNLVQTSSPDTWYLILCSKYMETTWLLSKEPGQNSPGSAQGVSDHEHCVNISFNNLLPFLQQLHGFRVATFVSIIRTTFSTSCLTFGSNLTNSTEL
jgi:hypothetical protein